MDAELHTVRSPRLSVVVPTLNESARLPLLLGCLAAQTRPPDEVIVADADSADETRAIARAAGAAVVRGGMPAVGRNAGAAAASGDLLLFIDADSQPGPDFIERALAEYQARGLEIASAVPWCVETDPSLVFWCGVAETYLRAMEHIVPHASGVCILVSAALHRRIGGFDETIVLAEDHDYARRAARLGRYGLLRSVRVPASMRRAAHEGRWRLFGIFVYTEFHTLANIPIRHTPFEYTFGAFASEGVEGDAARTDGRRGRPGRVRALLRELEKPSSEVQTDAIGLQLVSTIGGGLGTVALASAGFPPETYLPFAGATAAIATASTYEALRKLRFERHYGDFFSASVAVASADVRDGAGRVIVRHGVDEVCELHAINHLGRMATLNGEGLRGRLQIVLETLEGMRAMMEDMDDPSYHNVRYVTARSNITTLLFKLGFDEIGHPPPYDLLNRWDKRVLMWAIGRRVGRSLSGDADSYRMAVTTKECFAGEVMRAALDAQIERTRRDMVRAARNGHGAPEPASALATAAVSTDSREAVRG